MRRASRLHVAVLVAASLVGCEAEVTEDCSAFTAEECGADTSCALTFAHGCRNVCETDEDCTEGESCREVHGARYPGTGEDSNPEPRVVCVPP